MIVLELVLARYGPKGKQYDTIRYDTKYRDTMRYNTMQCINVTSTLAVLFLE